MILYLTVQFLHGNQIQGLQRVSRGGDEVQTDVDSRVVVVEEGALDLQLLLKVVLKLRVDVVHDWLITADGDTNIG